MRLYLVRDLMCLHHDRQQDDAEGLFVLVCKPLADWERPYIPPGQLGVGVVVVGALPVLEKTVTEPVGRSETTLVSPPRCLAQQLAVASDDILEY